MLLYINKNRLNKSSLILYFITLSLLSITILWTGCSVPYQPNIPDTNPKLVVNGHFRSDSIWRISVSQSIPVGSDDFPLIFDNADVELYEIIKDGDVNTELFLEKLSYFPPLQNHSKGFYKTIERKATPGIYYKIVVKVPGFDKPATGVDMIPEKPAISDVTYQASQSGNSSGSHYFTYKINDVETINNYFHVLSKKRKVIWSLNENGDTLFNRLPFEEESILIFGEQLDPIVTPNTYYYASYPDLFNGVIFSDESFREQSNLMELQMNFEKETQTFYEVQIETRSVSQAYFYYYRDLIQTINNSGNPFNDLNNFYNNIENGLGNYSGFQVSNSQIIRIE